MTVVELIKALVYGLVEGITEWLPVSSTAHLLILSRFLPFSQVSETFFDFFKEVIQLAPILAAFLLFFHKIWPLGRAKDGRVRWKRSALRLWLRLIVACLPLPVVKVLGLDDWIPGDHMIAIAIALISMGIVFIVVERARRGVPPKKRRLSAISLTDAALIGLCQALAAVFPGVSRSGATVMGALLLGISRGIAVEFTFILSIPVMAADAAYNVLKAVLSGAAFSGSEILILLSAMAVAFLISMAIVRPLLRFVRRHSFEGFGVYRIVLGAAILVLTALSIGGF